MLFFNFNYTVLAGGDIKTSIFFSIIRIYYTRHYRNFLKRKQAMPQHKSYNVLRKGTSHWNLSQELLLLRWWNWGPGLSYLGLFGTACYLCLARHFGKKCSIWPQEKHFAFVKSFLLRIFFFFFLFFFLFLFFVGWGPSWGDFMQGASSVLKALLLKNIVTIVFKLKQCSGRLWI